MISPDPADDLDLLVRAVAEYTTLKHGKDPAIDWQTARSNFSERYQTVLSRHQEVPSVAAILQDYERTLNEYALYCQFRDIMRANEVLEPDFVDLVRKHISE